MTLHGQKVRAVVLGLLCGTGSVACTPESEPQLVASAHTHFTIHGRLDAPALSYAIDSTDAPVDHERFAEACRTASAVWNDTGLAEIRLNSNQAPSLTISFQRDVHGECTPFGRSTTLAHTGPCGKENFLHLDAERDWQSDPSLLDRVLAHEFGHALGLGHSLDPAALMNPEPHALRTTPQASDLAGLHSLYGGGEDTQNDLVLLDGACTSEAPRLAVLRGVAPVDCSLATAFDTQGDGLSEILVWSTQVGGPESLTIFSYDENFHLRASVGPLYGLCPAGSDIRFGVSSEGERLLLRIQSDDSVHGLSFDERGALQQRTNAAFALGNLSDRDGDGQLDQPFERVIREGPCLLEADLNQDGSTESLIRVRETSKR